MRASTEIKDSSKLRETLMEGETILWRGRPESFPLITAATKKGLVIRWLACAAAFVLLTVCYVLFVNSKDNLSFNFVVEAVLLLICAYVALLPALDRNKIIKKCCYYVTDSRVIVAVGDNDAFPLSRKGLKVLRVPGADGCVTMLFGSNTAQPERKHRVGTFVPGKDENGENITGITFYNVKDDPALKAYFPA